VIVSIHQPAYFPWLGLVEKVALCERFVLLDNVQFNARAFQHRTLYSAPGTPRYLTLPVHASGCQQLGTPIHSIPLADPAAPARHFRTLAQRYGRTRGWPRVEERLRAILAAQPARLLDIALPTLELTLDCFGVATEVIAASSLRATGRKGALMLAIAREAGATTYLSGAGARDYLEPAAFERGGMGLAYQDFRHPVYPQSHGGEFQPGCLALEWYLEAPDEAPEAFHAQVAAARARLATG
jgi:hypothetical protein